MQFNVNDELLEPSMDRNAKIGIILFFVYAAIYSGFVMVNAFAPQWLDQSPWLGINLSLWYGLFLIAFAFALSLVYGWLCRSNSSQTTE
jgi:uncharacterized membrane protein (DUF485 family)